MVSLKLEIYIFTVAKTKLKFVVLQWTEPSVAIYFYVGDHKRCISITDVVSKIVRPSEVLSELQKELRLLRLTYIGTIPHYLLIKFPGRFVEGTDHFVF